MGRLSFRELMGGLWSWIAARGSRITAGGSSIAVGAVLTLTGCHHGFYGPGYYNNMGPYQPMPAYGPNTMPPGGYIAPSQPYIPGNGSPTPLPGDPASPTPLNNNSNSNSPTPMWRNDPGGNDGLDDAPGFNSNPSNPSERTVPDPLDADFNSSPQGAAALPRSSNIIPTAAISSGAPRRLTAIPTEAAVDPEHDTQAYAFDPKYTWLKGVVDYDEETQSWAIIYDLVPEPNDHFGGVFVFAPHEALRGVTPGQLVKVYGQADPGVQDSRGKPIYQIRTLTPIGPTPQS
jgi:hypothetical protein